MAVEEAGARSQLRAVAWLIIELARFAIRGVIEALCSNAPLLVPLSPWV